MSSSSNKKDLLKLNESEDNKLTKNLNNKSARKLVNSDRSNLIDFKNEILLDDILDFKKAQLLNSSEVLEFFRDKNL